MANKFLYDNDLQNKNADAALEEIPASAQNNADEDPGELSVGAKISLAITFFMSIAFAASLFGYIRLSEFAINRFIVSALIIALFYILYKLFRVFFRKLLSFRFWVKTFRINPRTLVKANFWFALILKPVLSLIALFFLLAAWGVSVDILLNKIKTSLSASISAASTFQSPLSCSDCSPSSSRCFCSARLKTALSTAASAR